MYTARSAPFPGATIQGHGSSGQSSFRTSERLGPQQRGRQVGPLLKAVDACLNAQGVALAVLKLRSVEVPAERPLVVFSV